jgi:hypothetical protein
MNGANHIDLDFIERACNRFGRFSFAGRAQAKPTLILEFTAGNQFIYIDGLNETELIAQLNNRELPDDGIIAGYVPPEEQLWSSDFDVFFFNSRLLAEDQDIQDLVVFHEVCHLLERRCSFRGLVSLKEADYRVGIEIERVAHMVDDMFHNIQFGALLHAFLRETDHNRSHEWIQQAMQWNFGEDSLSLEQL